MQAVILAGGVGSRLDKLSNGRPKCLVEIGGKPLILHQLEALADHGVGPVLMVVGYKHEMIREVVGERVEYLVNERYRETNSLYSLWLAREWITGPFVLANCDLFADPEIVRRLLEEPGNVLAYDSTSSRGREQTKVAIRDRRVVDLGKDLPPGAARGESLGLLKFDESGAKVLHAVVEQLVQQGQERAWVIEATRLVCKTLPMYGVNVAGLSWTEVDFPHDLAHARREVWPDIWRRRWGRFVYWRRTRWAAATAVALTLALGGWLASTRVGPGSIDWENVAPLDAREVTLARSSAPQKWWLATREASVLARVDGGTALRIEFRLLMSPAQADSGRYVVAVTVDGKPHDWEAFTATPDSTVVFPGAIVGDRDRLEFSLPRGRHAVRIALLAGRGDRLLVRLRRPE